MKKTAKTAHCPCGSGFLSGLCCQRLLSGKESAKTPLELMRSRYVAYILNDNRYLKHTWYPGSRPDSAILSDPAIKWLRLQIIRHEEAAEDGLVEFVAYCKVNGRAGKMHETSRFLKENGKWYYLDGTFSE